MVSAVETIDAFVVFVTGFTRVDVDAGMFDEQTIKHIHQLEEGDFDGFRVSRAYGDLCLIKLIA